MRKIAIIGAVIGSLFLLGGCDDNTAKLTPDQIFQLKQMELATQENMRNQRHELEMAKALHPAPVVKNETRYVESPPEVVYQNVPTPAPQPATGYPDSYDVRSDSGSSGGGVGSHVAAAAVGAAAGYMGGKYMSTPKGQQQYNTAKQKAYTGYRFTKSKATSKYRSFKSRKK